MTIYTSFHGESSPFSNLWEGNTLKYADRFVCVGTGKYNPYKTAMFIPLDFNLGHVGTLMAEKKDQLSGWTAHVAVLAMIAYSSGKDLIFKEQDAIWHGPVIETMYKEMGDRKFIFGKKMDSAPWMLASQSTFIVKWDFLPQWTSLLLGLPPCRTMLSEDKFVAIEQAFPELSCRTELGPERQRPIDWDSECWYAQKLNESELEIWKNIG